MDDAQLKAVLAQASRLSVTGEFGQARALCQLVFQHNPGILGALQTYVSITRIAPDDPVLARLRSFATATHLPNGMQSQIQFLLGKALDDIGDHEGAFAAFVAANELAHVPFDSAGQDRLAQAVLQAVAGLAPMQLAACTPRMVFVLGMPRSGSSILSQILGLHPEITVLGEVTALGQIVKGLDPDYPRFIATLTKPRLAHIRAAYLAAIAPQAKGGAILVDKMPENYWLGWLIPMLFPDALILEPRRPPLATCWSCFRNDFAQGHGYSTDFPALWAQYQRYLALSDIWRKRAGVNWHILLLANLVAAPEATLAPILGALGLEWRAEMGQPEKARGNVQTLSKWQARQKLDSAIADGWQNYHTRILARWGNMLEPKPQDPGQ
ncbi:MAG: sulfotransferase [Roseinatronobacter sp.]|nr:sulfotransferase [Roseinatronobacter sp.]